ncbi:Dual specificity mitogen-activated protein kinase kinase hemipterous [Portunus trituberculatus]|uniref:Dual specificity mitogen-activated protein kinase kinase hemipterous n=1 Tax=Portunus trituberculatus TaxID=210409 RepID=A0A5B7FDU9_PORTR|nr:Dual specificity mitogen-activated protein kinase kinase hemipterous [Portunus trituberculatus]
MTGHPGHPHHSWPRVRALTIDNKLPMRPNTISGRQRERPKIELPLLFEPRQQQSDLPELDAHVKEITRKNGNLVIESKSYKSSIEDMEYISELGNGTSGNVVKMLHKSSKKVIAVKQMRRSGNLEETKRVFFDLEVVLKSDCPFIVQCLGCFITDSDVWICMELMATCLDKLTKRYKKPIPEPILGKISVAVLTKVLQDDPPSLPKDGTFSSEFCDFVNDCLIKEYRLRPKYKKLLDYAFIKKYEQKKVDVSAWFAGSFPQPPLSAPHQYAVPPTTQSFSPFNYSPRPYSHVYSQYSNPYTQVLPPRSSHSSFYNSGCGSVRDSRGSQGSCSGSTQSSSSGTTSTTNTTCSGAGTSGSVREMACSWPTPGGQREAWGSCASSQGGSATTTSVSQTPPMHRKTPEPVR